MSSRDQPTLLIDNLKIHDSSAIDPADLPLPIVPGYDVQSVLGGGGMGVVYRAVDTALSRPVALKMIVQAHVGATTRQRFQTEAQTVARLRHPNFVQIYEVGEHDGRPFLALELVEGGSLIDHLTLHGPLPARAAAQLVATLSHAMHHAHEQGVVHRDLKPGNILLSAGSAERNSQPRTAAAARAASAADASGVRTQHASLGTPKISDFGLAKLLDSDQTQTRSGTVLGTPVYMAPEQARGAGQPITPATDIYALGAILYECLTGRPPFVGDSSWEVLLQVIHVDPLPPSLLRPRLSRDLDTICLKCLHKDPARRYASAEELGEDLDRFAAGEAITARPEGSLRRLGRRLRRRPVTAALTLLLIGAVALTGGFWELRRAQGEAALEDGRELARRGDHAAAAARFDAGALRVERLPGCAELRRELFRAWAAATLRDLTEQLMFLYHPEHLDAAAQQRLADQARRLWDQRQDILAYASERDPAWEQQVRADLRDVALRELEIRQRLAGPDSRPPSEIAGPRLDELRDFGAPSSVVEVERDGGQAPDLTAARTDSEYYLLGRAFWRRGNLDAAEECFRAGARLNPRGLDLNFALATLFYQKGDYRSAETYHTICLSLATNSLATLFSRRGFANLAAALGAAGSERAARRDLQLARSDFDAALQRAPGLAEAHFGRGQVLHRLGQHELARVDFDAALDLGYPRERVLYPLAVALFDTGAREEARRRLQQFLTLRPGDREALAMIDELDRRQGKRKPAAELPNR